jgi:hypothetical protein
MRSPRHPERKPLPMTLRLMRTSRRRRRRRRRHIAVQKTLTMVVLEFGAFVVFVGCRCCFD